MSATTRLRPSIYGNKPITTTLSVICSQSETRTALTFTATTADVFISPDPNQGSGEGLRITAGQVITMICGCHQGDFVRRQLFARTTVGTANLYVIEGFEPWPDQNPKS